MNRYKEIAFENILRKNLRYSIVIDHVFDDNLLIKTNESNHRPDGVVIAKFLINFLLPAINKRTNESSN